MPQTKLFETEPKPKSRYHKVPTERHIVGTRGASIPDAVPENWIVCNAPRPLYGDYNWEGPFITGVFYAGIDPEGDEAAFCLHRNAELDARRLIFHTRQELIDYAVEWYRVNYPEAYEKIELDDKDHVRGLVNCALSDLNKPQEG